MLKISIVISVILILNLIHSFDALTYRTKMKVYIILQYSYVIILAGGYGLVNEYKLLRRLNASCRTPLNEKILFLNPVILRGDYP